MNAASDEPTPGQSPVVAVISDGKTGHVNQSLGLAEALQRSEPTLLIRVEPALSRRAALAARFRRPARFRDVSLLIGAGHGTHLSLLALRRRDCPAIVLMRPSLPGRCFDLRIEPRHDGGSECARCWLSDGPLNRMRPGEKDPTLNLMLIGGPSPHFSWDEAALLTQVMRLCDGGGDWQLSGSRRTPPDFLEALHARNLPGLTVHAAGGVPPGWLPDMLGRAARVWVTPDSASMVYEALTAGAAVGLFDLTPQPGSRVAAAMGDLRMRGLVWGFTAGAAVNLRDETSSTRAPLAEADRIAARLRERGWL
jgi:mitochondrial fission protein ELM1